MTALRERLAGLLQGREAREMLLPLMALASKRAGFAGVVIVVALASAWLLWNGGPAIDPGAEARSRTAPAEGDTLAAKPIAGTRESSTNREEVGSVPTAAAPAMVRGRCVAAEDRRPLAGCVVAIEGNDGLDVTTGIDGRFTLPLPDAGFTLNVSAPGRVPLHGLWSSGILVGQTEELGDVALKRGFAVRGRVSDPSGEPVPEVTVCVFGDCAAPGRLSAHVIASGITAADGTFALTPDLPAGTWHAQVLTRSLQGDGQFQVDAFTGAAPLLLIVEPNARSSIAGVVVDDSGDPVGQVMVTTAHREASAMTGSDGKFVLTGARAQEPDTTVVISSPGRCEPDATPHPAAWGTTDLRIVLRRARALTLEVVDDGDRPVTAFGVWVGSEQKLVHGDQFSRGHGHHEGGRAVVQGVRRGRNLLRVFPHAPELLASEAQLVEVTDGELKPVRVVLQRLVSCPVHVVNADGAAVAGADIRLLRMRGELRDSVDGHRSLRGKADWYPNSRRPELVAKAVTGTGGSASLFTPADTQGFLLRIDHPAFAPFHQVAPRMTASAALLVTLAAPATLTGRLILHGQPRSLFSVIVDTPDGSRVQVGEHGGRAIQPDGTFTLERLLPGRYTLRPSRRVEWHDHRGTASWSQVPLEPAERIVEVAGGAALAVEIDAPVPAFGTLRGRLSIEGSEPAGWNVDLVQAFGNGAVRGMFAIGAGGAFTADELLPGRYRLQVRRPGPTSGSGAQLAETFEIPPGAEVAREFRFTPRRLVLRLRHPDGSAVASPWEFRCGTSISWAGDRREFIFDPAPELAVECRLRIEGAAWSAPVSMPQDRTEWTTDVILPAAR